ncbi:Cys/Met metabolism pyridoxal phosphate-dependent enzyme [Trinorchestia longiramus]|nr:Cys/Met metabolism pyridoxal phosphate-dependent enzyme [Trinorchestia longiramus]
MAMVGHAENEGSPSPYPPNAPSLHTRAVHVGFEVLKGASGALVPPITLSTIFAQTDPEHKEEYFYGRLDNPSRDALQRSLASLEEAEYAVAFGSGMAAIASVLQMLKVGDHALVSKHLYSGTHTFFTSIATRQGVHVEFMDMRRASDVSMMLRSNTRVVWIETPSNPTMEIIDIAALAAIIQQHNHRSAMDRPAAKQVEPERNTEELEKEDEATMLVIDNTFLSGVFQRPLSLGADLVVQSCTKYINGSTDVIMGSICTNSSRLNSKLKFLQASSGAIPSPFDCYLVQRSIRTLPVRMERHSKNCEAVARFLETHSCVKKVNHPGLRSHPQHELSVRQSFGHSGMMSFYLIEDDLEKSKVFLKALSLVTFASSLGGVESLAELPLTMSHGGLPPEENAEGGITAGLVRLSVGLEDPQDLIKDLDQALKKAFQKG